MNTDNCEANHTGEAGRIDTPKIIQTEAKLVAKIHLKVPRSEMQEVMGPGVVEVMAAARAQGIGPTGPWFTHHLKMEPGTFDFEICVPVSAPVKPVGRVVAGEWPAMSVARTVLHGGYEGLGNAWGEFYSWMKANGHVPAADLYECYVAGPESGADPANWRTELSSPLA
ncbi:MAG: GyrI-like domain-containing protein [Betaproteobacteria bacterium]